MIYLKMYYLYEIAFYFLILHGFYVANLLLYSDQKQVISELVQIEKRVKSSKLEVDQRLAKLNKVINEINAQLHEWRVKVLYI